MKFYEYGEKELPVIMLVHGGGNSYWMFEQQALLLKKDYRVILPLLDGHGEEKENTYHSTIEEADKIIDYIDETCNGQLFAIGGASLGAQIALEVLSRREDFIKKAVIESGICLPKPMLAKFICNKWMLKSMSLLYQYHWIVQWSCKMYGWPISKSSQIAEDAKSLSLESNRNLYQTYFNYNIPESLSKTKAEVLFLFGSKEKGIMKKDVQEAAKHIPGSRLEELKGYHHCEFSLGDPIRYVEELTEFFNKDHDILIR